MPHSSPIFIAASAGGHLDEMATVAEQVLDGRKPTWVTSRTERGHALRESASEVHLLPEFGRNPVRALVNVIAAARIVATRRPRFVLTSGAGVVVPFCVLARLCGARLVYLETVARVSTPSLSTGILARIATKVVVQWPELRRRLPRASVSRPILFENISRDGNGSKRGTFVAVGTHSQPHGRLLEIVERGVEDGLLPTPVVAQVGGAPHRLEGARVFAHMSRDELEAAIRDAAVVVCHGGAGIISLALREGKKPIVVPRRAALGEHVDDHQYQLTRKLAALELAVAVEDRITPQAVQQAAQPPRPPEALRQHPTAAQIVRREIVRCSEKIR